MDVFTSTMALLIRFRLLKIMYKVGFAISVMLVCALSISNFTKVLRHTGFSATCTKRNTFSDTLFASLVDDLLSTLD